MEERWFDEELSGCRLGDGRLDRRLRQLVERMEVGFGESIPLACQDWAGTKAAYRFFSNERVSEEDILPGHFDATRHRFAASDGPILVLHDTTEFSWRRKRPEAVGFAPEARAARVLERESGMNVRTLQWFLTRCGSAVGDDGATDRLRQMFGGSLVVLDEASLVSTDRMGSLMRIADRLGVARLVLVGDTGQLRAVEAGQPFLQLQRAGMTTVQMDEVRCQRNPVLRAAVLASRSGEPGKAVELLGSNMHEVAFDELGEAAARIWLALAPEARDRTLLLAPTHALRAEINGTIRAELADEGVLRGKALTIERLVSLGMTGAEKGDVRNYREGDAVMFHQDMVNYRVRKDEALTVTGIEGDRVLLRHPDGGPRHIKPAGRVRYDLEVYETRPIEIRAGDRIRWTRNDHGRELINGERAEVAAIARGRVRLVLEDGRKVSLRADDPQLRHIDYAWSSTVRGAQGDTADGVIAVLDTSQRALTDQSTFYVEISRARDRAVVLTDNLDELVEVLEANTGERATALDAVGEPIEMDVQALAQRIPEKGRICTPGEEWAAVEARARREGTVAFRADGYDALMERARTLAEQPDLPAATQEVLDGLDAYDRACREGDAAAREFLGLLAAHAETRRGLEEAAGAAGRAIAGLDGYGDWRALSARLIANGEALLAELGARAGDAGGDIRDGLGRLPALHALDDAHRAFETLRDEVTAWAEEEDTIPYYAEGHDALLERARALVAMADLPAHAREAAGEVIAEAEVCERRRAEIDALRAEATRLLKERGEMEAALSEVPEDQLVPYTEGADYAAWSARCEAAAERWQAMRDEPDTCDPHLDRPGVGRAALEADVQKLQDLRGHDEAWAKLYVMHSGIAERARAEDKATFDLPEWNELADKARALKARPGLPEAADRAAEAVLDYDSRCRFLPDAEAHGARWDALRAEAARGENVSIIDLPGYAPLTEAERALHATGKAILADGGGPHLDRVPDGAERATAALERLESHALLDRCVAAMGALKEAAGGAWASLPGDSLGESAKDAEELAKERALEDEARRRLEAEIEEQAALLARLAAIRQLLRDVEALDRLEQEFGESPARYERLPRSLVPGWEDWRAAHEAFPEAARPPLEDAAFEEFRQARPDLVDEIRKAVRIARDRLALAAPEPDLDTVMSGAEYRDQESAWQPDATDFPIACGWDVVEGDLVCFSMGADSLPGGDGEEREVRVVAELVTRSAKMSELHDPCTLETLWRSDGGPTGQITVPLGTLDEGGCARAVWVPGGTQIAHAEDCVFRAKPKDDRPPPARHPDVLALFGAARKDTPGPNLNARPNEYWKPPSMPAAKMTTTPWGTASKLMKSARLNLLSVADQQSTPGEWLAEIAKAAGRLYLPPRVTMTGFLFTDPASWRSGEVAATLEDAAADWPGGGEPGAILCWPVDEVSGHAVDPGGEGHVEAPHPVVCPSIGGRPVIGPYLFLGAVDRSTGRWACVDACARPIAALDCPVPVDSDYERQAVGALRRLVETLASHPGLAALLGGTLRIELEKPLALIETPAGACQPDFVLSVVRPSAHGHLPGGPDDPPHLGRFDPRYLAQYVIEVMGFASSTRSGPASPGTGALLTSSRVTQPRSRSRANIAATGEAPRSRTGPSAVSSSGAVSALSPDSSTPDESEPAMILRLPRPAPIRPGPVHARAANRCRWRRLPRRPPAFPTLPGCEAASWPEPSRRSSDGAHRVRPGIDALPGQAGTFRTPG